MAMAPHTPNVRTQEQEPKQETEQETEQEPKRKRATARGRKREQQPQLQQGSFWPGMAAAAAAAPPVSERSVHDKCASPEALVRLWNERHPAELPVVKTLSKGLRAKVIQVLEQFPSRAFWEQVMDEYQVSRFLRAVAEHGPRDFAWLVSVDKEGVENVVKVVNGKYRDRDTAGTRSSVSPKTAGNLEAAVDFLRDMGFGPET